MSYFLKSGNTYRVASDEAMDIHRKLPAGNYVVKLNEMSGELYLESIEDFTIPSKIYGNCLKNTDKIIRTFLDRDNATGVMMTGEKGSGKTLLTKNNITTNIPSTTTKAPRIILFEIPESAVASPATAAVPGTATGASGLGSEV